MAKFYGEIGFSETVEIPPDSGKFREVLTKRPYYGDIVKNTLKSEESEHQNRDINITNRFSIVADDYALSNFSFMRCLSWMNSFWEIRSIEIAYPRLIISIGGVYNEQET